MGTLIKINGFDIFHEVTGKGAPIIWCHEAAGDYRSWVERDGVRISLIREVRLVAQQGIKLWQITDGQAESQGRK